jgi:hypothetical protein
MPQNTIKKEIEMSEQHKKMVEKAKEVKKQNNEDVPEWMTWKPTKAQLLVLKKKGIVQDWGELEGNEFSLRELARTCDMSEAWTRIRLKSGKIPSKRDKRNRYVVTKATVMQIRFKFAQKHLKIAKREEDGVKYSNKAPRQFAYDMTCKKIKEDSKLTPNQKKVMLSAMERYKAEWNAQYQARQAKIAENKAKEAAK